MTHWVYRDAFDARYREYRKRTKATVKEVADALGKSASSINSWRRKGGGTTPPGSPGIFFCIFLVFDLLFCSGAVNLDLSGR
jgi:hypothetical protein